MHDDQPTPLEPPTPANRPPFGAVWSPPSSEPAEVTEPLEPEPTPVVDHDAPAEEAPVQEAAPVEPAPAPAAIDPLSDEYVVPEEDLGSTTWTYHDLEDTISSSVPLYVEPEPPAAPAQSAPVEQPGDEAAGSLLDDFLAEDDADGEDDDPEPDGPGDGTTMWRPSRWIGNS